MPRHSAFSPEVREHAIRMVQEQSTAHGSRWAAIRSIAEKLGCHPETLRNSMRRATHREPSMSRKGNCWANAVADSFFSSLKKERIKNHIYQNRALALVDVTEYIDSFFNSRRRHSHLGCISPAQFEAAQKLRRQAVDQAPGTPKRTVCARILWTRPSRSGTGE